MDPHIYFISQDLPSSRRESSHRKWIKIWLWSMQVFLFMRSRFFFKPEISLSILQPFIWLVTIGHTQNEAWKSAKQASDSLSFSYIHILVCKHCTVLQVSAMDLKVKINFSLTRHWNLWKSLIQCDHLLAKPLAFYFNTFNGPVFKKRFQNAGIIRSWIFLLLSLSFMMLPQAAKQSLAF